jgi:hypothetical protein
MPRLTPPKNLPGRPKIVGIKKQIHFTMNLIGRLNEYRTYIKNKTNFKPSFNDTVRSVLDVGLTKLGIPNESEDDDENC